MKTADAWRLSAVPYSELAFKSILQNSGNMWWGSFGRGTRGTSGREDLVKRALDIARFDKVIVAVFVAVAAAAPFIPRDTVAPGGLAASVSLSLAASFALIVLYGVQTLSSYVSTGPSPVLSTLPLTRSELSLVNLLCFVRTGDLLVVGSVACQVVVVSLATGSVGPALFMLLAGVANSALAVGASLWLSSVIYRGVSGSKRGSGSGILRFALLIGWGIVVLGIGVLFAGAGYLIPAVQGALAGGSASTASALSAVYPFSLGVCVESAASGLSHTWAEEVALAATVAYLPAAAGVARWSAASVASLPETVSVASGREDARDTSVTVRRPVVAYAMKDLRAASANLPSAFLFALPTFETVVILLYRAFLPTLRASTVLVATALGGMVTLILPLVLVSSEGTGFDFAKTMPVRIRTVVFSKALIATAVFVPSVTAVLVEAALKPVSNPYLPLIPFATLAGVAAGCSLEVRLFLGFAPGGRAKFAAEEVARLAAGAAAVLLPASAYAAAYVLSSSHGLAAAAMASVSLAELAGAIGFVRRS